MIKLLLVLVTLGCLTVALKGVAAEMPHKASESVRLSPELLDLLRAEMREISAGIQTIPLSVATADWHSIQSAGKKMTDSYIMAQQLTTAQKHELHTALPERFKQLDAEFHHRAEKLESAAAARDSELLVFHFSRLLETCTSCHSQFAGSRFPAFSAHPAQGHDH